MPQTEKCRLRRQRRIGLPANAVTTAFCVGRSVSRLLEPDAMPLPAQADGAKRLRVAAIQLHAAGSQALVWSDVTLRSGLLRNQAEPTAWNDWPVQGRPWNPAFRPGHEQLTWVCYRQFALGR